MKKMILFGAGEYGKMALHAYGLEQVAFFTDNDPEKTGTFYCGKKVLSFDELKDLVLEFPFSYDIAVTVEGDKFLPISEQLKESGIFFDLWLPSIVKSEYNVPPIIAKTYLKLCDTISRKIFEYRLMRFLTNDACFTRKMVRLACPAFDSLIHSLGQSKLHLCDTSLYERSFSALFRKEVHGFLDVDMEAHSKAMQVHGLPAYPFERIDDFKQDTFILPFINERKSKIVLHELEKHGIPERQIFDPAQGMKLKEMYFDLPYLEVTDNEVFVDCGAYDGDTVKCFLEWAGSGKVFAFEPELEQYEISKKNLKGIPDVSLVNAGVWHKNDTLSFAPLPCGGSRIYTEGKDCINVVSLDDFLGNERVTFIKMDIEGAEVNAMKGAAEIIRKQKPKLAISIYHNHEDILTIPETILRLNPSYKLYLRHYTLGNADTVLYAI